jgi:hypothetical protein
MADQFEEQRGAIPRERDEAEYVDDQQLLSGNLPLRAKQLAIGGSDNAIIRFAVFG